MQLRKPRLHLQEALLLYMQSHGTTRASLLQVLQALLLLAQGSASVKRLTLPRPLQPGSSRRRGKLAKLLLLLLLLAV